jgi:adenylate cyclase
MTATRRLAAIMAVDVVGYSRLMGEDEAGTARAVREHREAARPMIANLGGRIVKTMGDGLLLEFPSVVAAVECAVAIQKLMAERNADVPEAKRVVYRVGVNLGDVLIEGDDILGDGVNIAARLEAICEPGGVLISSTAHDHVRGKIDAEFVDLGERTLKNIARPVRVFAVATGSKRPATESSAAKASEPPRLSIVVLPFANMASDSEHEYFVDGVTESLTTDLSRIRGSFVIGRNTAFTYKGKAVDLKQIGRELNVRYVLEGSVQRGGNRMRVNVQLIDAETGSHLWAERFDKPLADLFDMQDEIVARLATALNVQLTVAEARRAEKASRIGNLDAFDLTLRGRALTFQPQPTRENNEAARAMYEQALAIDPNDAAALAGDAGTYLSELAFGWTNPATDYAAKVLAQVDRSIALARDDPRPYLVKSLYLTITRRLEEGLRAADAGLSVNPNYAPLHAARGHAEIYLGHFEQGKTDVRQAMRLSPRDPSIGNWHNFLCLPELGLGHYDAAIGEANNALDAGYRVFLVHAFLAAAHALKGEMAVAKTALAEARRQNPKLTVKSMAERYANIPTLLEGLRKAGLPES